MAFRLFSVLLLAGSSWSCDPWNNSTPSHVSGSDNQINTQRMENVPYCPDGHRDKRCLLGKNCRLSSKGCQVCQCEGLDD
ncbi:MAG: hypothetical protein RL033_5404 [Pseudomonadota bacterium]|jgi:hypothetical protein